MENLWNDPITEQRKNEKIVKSFTADETREIKDRLNKSFEEADRISRRAEAIAIEHASRAFLTF